LGMEDRHVESYMEGQWRGNEGHGQRFCHSTT
jgi:hypothetical protein